MEQLVDNNYKATDSCVHFDSYMAYFTIDLLSTRNIKTIYVTAENNINDPTTYETLGGVRVFAHNDEFSREYLCPITMLKTGFYDCQVSARYVTF